MAEMRPGFSTRGVTIAAGNVQLAGDLTVPQEATAIVLFAHGSGSSRHSQRNQYVARQLADAGLATLLFDLLTAAEEDEDRWTGKFRFDVLLLAHRLSLATKYVRDEPETQELRVGYFGASTGAAAALIAAAALSEIVGAVVSRGGRPDLAADALTEVTAPTLLIVGGDDREVLQLNREAYAQLRCEKRLEIIPGATHLFEEPGALEAVARLASAWFQRFLVERIGRQPGSEPAGGTFP
jgi:putative phosphoribosyl transferase